MLEEMRWLEYGQRLRGELRGALPDAAGDVAPVLLAAATTGGAAALGRAGRADRRRAVGGLRRDRSRARRRWPRCRPRACWTRWCSGRGTRPSPGPTSEGAGGRPPRRGGSGPCPSCPTSPSTSTACAPRVVGQPLERLTHPQSVRAPLGRRRRRPTSAARRVTGLRRLGKRIVLALEGERFLVIHLMIAGRLRWLDRRRQAARAGSRWPSFEFPTGTLVLTEAGTTRRASIHLVAGEAELAAVRARRARGARGRRGRRSPRRLASENHTLKRALTDPRLFSGIGNAYSDEILHRARLSPLALTRKLAADDDRAPVRRDPRPCCVEWTDRLRAEAGDGFPEKVTAFREGMAVHGRYRQALPGLRRAGAAHPLRRQRDQLLRPLPDGRPAARRPRDVPAAARGLAALDRRPGVIFREDASDRQSGRTRDRPSHQRPLAHLRRSWRWRASSPTSCAPTCRSPARRCPTISA